MTAYGTADPIFLGGPTGPAWYRGAFDPSAVGQAANQGSIFSRTDVGNVYVKIGPLNTDWLLLGGGGGGVINEMWGPRVGAVHPADDEFDTGALDAAWLQTGAGAALNFGARPNPYVDPGAVIRASWENRRSPDVSAETSWLRIQPGAASGISVIWQPLDSAAFGGAVPADLLVWGRFNFGWRNAQAVAGGDNDVGISIFQDDATGPVEFTFANHCTINLSNTQEGTANQIKPVFWARNADTGIIVVASEGNPNNNLIGNESDAGYYSGYIALQKIAGTYYAWVLDDAMRLFMGVLGPPNAPNANVNAVALWCRTASGATPGAMIFDYDYVRFYQGADWIP